MELSGLLSIFGKLDHRECSRYFVLLMLMKAAGYYGCMAFALG